MKYKNGKKSNMEIICTLKLPLHFCRKNQILFLSPRLLIIIYILSIVWFLMVDLDRCSDFIITLCSYLSGLCFMESISITVNPFVTQFSESATEKKKLKTKLKHYSD